MNDPTNMSQGSLDIRADIAADSYTEPLIRSALSKIVPHLRLSEINQQASTTISQSEIPLLQIKPYEDIDFDHHLAHPTTSLANSYVIRKALTRKHHLWSTVSSWWTKHPDDTSLKGHVPLTVTFELDYAEFLDDALLECFELHDSFRLDEREWWVLKPAMSDQGHGVRLFSSLAELRAIFEEWEEDSDENDDEDENDDDGDGTDQSTSSNGETVSPSNLHILGARTMTSQLRYFIAQRYVDPPMLFPQYLNRKFHIRTYTVAVGALKVYVYKEMLALFAPSSYESPPRNNNNDDGTATAEETRSSSWDPRIHLTNTCLHSSDNDNDNVDNNHLSPTNENDKPINVIPFWDLPSHPLTPPSSTPPSSPTPATTTTTWHHDTFTQILTATSTLFTAAARNQMIHFQTLPNSFEIFGIDWLVDAAGTVWLLEVNAFPDFKQSGEGGEEVVRRLWEGVVGVGVRPFFGRVGVREGKGGGGEEKGGEGYGGDGMVEVLDIDLGRR